MPTQHHRELNFLTLAEAAQVLRLSKRTILRMIQKRKIPATRLGRQWRFREANLLAWVKEQETDVSAGD
jgi:excisionase family DNA binding protein